MVAAERLRQVEWRLVAIVAFAAAALVPAVAAALDVNPRVPTSYPAVYPVARVLDLAAGFGLVGVGLAGLVRRVSAVGPIAILLGIQWLAGDVASWQAGPVPIRSIAMLLLPLAIPVLAHLTVVGLDDLRERAASRRGLVVAYLVFGSTSVLHALTWTPTLDLTCWMQCAGNSFLVAPRPDLARGIEVAWMAGSMTGGLAVAWMAVAAVASLWRLPRAHAAPILAPAALAAGALAIHGLFGLVRPPEVPEDPVFAGSYVLRALALSALAVGIASTTWAGWRRRQALARLAAELSDSPDAGAFQSALRRSIGDEDIEVAYWQPTYGRYVDVEGREVDPARGGRAISKITRDGASVALVLHDPALSGTRKLEDEIGAAARVALDNERLRSEILAQLDDLRRARVRIVETGDAARRRLERDLHDGVQQRLLAAAYELQLAQAPSSGRGPGDKGSGDDAVLSAALETARLALREIRSLAQGIHPLILTEGGLAAALDTFAEETAIAVELAVDRGERYPAHVETTAYAVVIEAVRDAVTRGATFSAISARRIRQAGRAQDGGRWHPQHRPARRACRSRRRAWRNDRAGAREPDGGAAMRVVVADDVMLTRAGIVRLLVDVGIEVVGEAGDGESAVDAVRRLRPDIVILDIRMPPTHVDEGLVAARAIRSEFPEIGVLVLSEYVEPGYALELIREQAEGVGYILKERVFDVVVLVDALRRIQDRETVVDPTIVSRLLGRRRRADPLDELSAREREVLGLVAEGRSNRAIADTLFVAERTVEAHIQQIFLKLDLAESPSDHRRVLAVLAFLRR